MLRTRTISHDFILHQDGVVMLSQIIYIVIPICQLDHLSGQVTYPEQVPEPFL